LKTPGIPISFCAPLYKWRTEDGKLQAVYSESKFLVITTTGYLKRLEEAAKEKKRAAEENKQKGSPISQKHQTARKRKFTPSARKSSSAPSGTRRLIQGKREQ